MENNASLEMLNYELAVLLRQVRHLMFRARSKELSRFGITPTQAALLFTVDAIGERATPTEISRWALREIHTISELLRMMERQGLLKRTKDLERKNFLRVSLTEKGRQACQNGSQRRSVHRIMSALSEEERRNFKRYLKKLRSKALKELGTEQPPFP